jgi:hypothetical protein
MAVSSEYIWIGLLLWLLSTNIFVHLEENGDTEKESGRSEDRRASVEER